MAEKKNYTAVADFEYNELGKFKAGDKVIKPDNWAVDPHFDESLQMDDKKAYARRQSKILKSGGDVPAGLKYTRRRTAFLITLTKEVKARLETGELVTREEEYYRRAVLPVQ